MFYHRIVTFIITFCQTIINQFFKNSNFNICLKTNGKLFSITRLMIGGNGPDQVEKRLCISKQSPKKSPSLIKYKSYKGTQSLMLKT